MQERNKFEKMQLHLRTVFTQRYLLWVHKLPQVSRGASGMLFQRKRWARIWPLNRILYKYPG